MRIRTIFQAVAVILLLALISAACSSSSDETAEQLLAVEQQLADVTAERDVLQTQIDQQADRHDKAAAVQSAVRDILDNPEAYGTEEEVVDLLASYATSDAVMQDDTFNASMNMRDSWYNTLYGGAMDAEIEVLHQWMSDDGSQVSGLWVWKGKNINGKDFELFGVAIDTHNEEGLISHELILYPYPDSYVTNAAFGTGTATLDHRRRRLASWSAGAAENLVQGCPTDGSIELGGVDAPGEVMSPISVTRHSAVSMSTPKIWAMSAADDVIWSSVRSPSV